MQSCTDYETADYYDLETLPSYVAFNAPGTSSFLDPIDVEEDAGSVSVNIEAPTGTLTDITITYSLGGTAVAGTDYNDTNNGTIVMTVDPEDVLDYDNVDLEFEILQNPDTIDKTLIVTLVSAVDADGNEFAVGRGGTDLLKEATINILNID
jgi:hypothetical protein